MQQSIQSAWAEMLFSQKKFLLRPCVVEDLPGGL